MPLGSPWPLALATLLAGMGHGLAAVGAQKVVGDVSPPERRAEVNSAFYLAIYVGVGLPVVGVGFAANATGLFPAVAAFAAVVGAVGLVIALLAATKGHELLGG